MAKYLAIKDNDIDNGPGLRVSVWFSGCPHKCRGCHNQESWDENKGKEFTFETIDTIINMLDGSIKQDLSILGGEPLAQYNIDETISLIHAVRKKLPEINIWLWTGYEMEELENIYQHEYPHVLLDLDVDVIVDGRYIKHLHVDDKYRGSSNQRLIAHNESLKTGKLTLI